MAQYTPIWEYWPKPTQLSFPPVRVTGSHSCIAPDGMILWSV